MNSIFVLLALALIATVVLADGGGHGNKNRGRSWDNEESYGYNGRLKFKGSSQTGEYLVASSSSGIYGDVRGNHEGNRGGAYIGKEVLIGVSDNHGDGYHNDGGHGHGNSHGKNRGGRKDYD